mgnify:CR=1 FL=1
MKEQLTRILDEFEHNVVSETSRMVKIKMICEDREAERPKIESTLRRAGVSFRSTDHSPDSSWGHLEVDDEKIVYRLFFKNQKQDACTAYFEGAQCMFLDFHQAFPDKPLTLENLRKTAFTDVHIDKQHNLCLTKLTKTWEESSAKIAKHLLSKLRRRDYVFHRASPTTKMFDDTFYRLNRNAFNHVDKWNPYDIACVSKSILSTLTNDLKQLKTLDQYNDWLRARLEDNTIILVSLKKVEKGEPTMYSINTPDYWSKQHDPAQFVSTKINTGRGDITSSNNCQLSFTKYGKDFDAIFRPSSPNSAVNCELKQRGTTAQDGKVHLFTVSDCFYHVGAEFDVTDFKWHGIQSKKGNTLIRDRIWQRACWHDTPGMTEDEYRAVIQDVSDNWLYSMDVGTAIVATLEGLPSKRQNMFCDLLYKNGAAQREDCGPYLKVMEKRD